MITQLYAALLRLYPRRFRVEFGEEMIAVFEEAAAIAPEQGLKLSLFLRELRDLPCNLAREHWYARIKKEFPMTIIKKPEWTFYPAWVILTMLSVPIAFIISITILFTIERLVGGFIYVDGVQHVTQDYLGGYVFVPIVSLVMGLLQFGLLRRYLPRMGGWVLATTGGWLLGVLLILIPGWFNFWTPESFNLDLAFLVLGLSIGIGQWLLLRRRLRRAGWWVGANVLGWVLLGLITTGNALGQFGLLLLGFLPACATAVVLALLINHAQPNEPQGA